MELLVILAAAGFLGAVYLKRRDATAGRSPQPPGSGAITGGLMNTDRNDGLLPGPGGVAGGQFVRDPAAPTAGAAAAQANVAAQAAQANASAKAALSGAALAEANARAAEAERARLGQFATLEQRAREANEAEAAAQRAQQAAEAAQRAAEEAARAAAAAAARAGAVLREKAPILEAKRAELAQTNQRIVALRAVVDTLARQRRGIADSIVRYPEVLRFVYEGPDNLTLLPYAGQIRAVDADTVDGLQVLLDTQHAASLGRSTPWPNVRLVQAAEVLLRTRWRAAAEEINRSLGQISTDENTAARLTGEVASLATEVQDAEAALGLGAPTQNVPMAGGVVSTILLTNADGTSGKQGTKSRSGVQKAN